MKRPVCAPSTCLMQVRLAVAGQAPSPCCPWQMPEPRCLGQQPCIPSVCARRHVLPGLAAFRGQAEPMLALCGQLKARRGALALGQPPAARAAPQRSASCCVGRVGFGEVCLSLHPYLLQLLQLLQLPGCLQGVAGPSPSTGAQHVPHVQHDSALVTCPLFSSPLNMGLGNGP